MQGADLAINFALSTNGAVAMAIAAVLIAIAQNINKKRK